MAIIKVLPDEITIILATPHGANYSVQASYNNVVFYWDVPITEIYPLNANSLKQAIADRLIKKLST